MHCGILLTTARPEFRTDEDVFDAAIQHAKTAERVGFDSAWVLEHHFTPYALNPDTLALSGYLLGATTKLTVGTAVTIAPFIHPIRLAESTSLLDQLSKGRFRLGLGRGICPEDFEVFGVDPDKSHELTRECVQILVDAWTKKTVTGKGPNYNFDEVEVVPRPFTKPNPPVSVAAESASSVEWAAKNGFPLLLQLGLEDEELRSRLELYSTFAEAAGHDPDAIDHVLMCFGHIAENKEKAKAEVFDILKWWGDESTGIGFDVDQLKNLPNYRFHLNRIEQFVLTGDDTETYISKWLDNSPVGSPEYCVERLEEMAEAVGVRSVVIGLEGPGQVEAIEHNIERFGSEVIPRLKSKTSFSNH